MNEKMPLNNVKGVVTQHAMGKHGLYVVTHSDHPKLNSHKGWITFDKKAWKEKAEFPPKEGTKVVMKIHKTTMGWRADKARLFRLSDSESESE